MLPPPSLNLQQLPECIVKNQIALSIHYGKWANVLWRIKLYTNNKSVILQNSKPNYILNLRKLWKLFLKKFNSSRPVETEITELPSFTLRSLIPQKLWNSHSSTTHLHRKLYFDRHWWQEQRWNVLNTQTKKRYLLISKFTMFLFFPSAFLTSSHWAKLCHQAKRKNSHQLRVLVVKEFWYSDSPPDKNRKHDTCKQNIYWETELKNIWNVMNPKQWAMSK